MDQYNERLVKGRPSMGDKAALIGSYVLVVIGAFLTLKVSFGLILLAGAIALAVFMSGRTSVEYEYTIYNGNIEVSKIYSMKSRKSIQEISAEDITGIYPLSDDHVKNDREVNTKLRVVDYTEQQKEEDYYAVYVTKNSNEILYIMDFNEECLKHFQARMKSKCFFAKIQ